MEEIEKDMTPRLIGETYLRKPTETSRERCKYWIYRCQYCGKEFECQTYSIKSGNTKSCGCVKGKSRITHGLSNHRFWKTWQGMIYRCNNTKSPSFINYGARGIKVCEEWSDVKVFIAWAESTYITGMTLDRIDNNGNYEPNNCTWADRTTQSIKQRKGISNTSGYVGITWVKATNKWKARIGNYGKTKHLGDYICKEEAVLARDQYIIENGLPHPLSTEY